MYPRVKKVKAEDDFRLRLTFNNGKTKIFNMTPYLNFGIFSELKNKTYFKKVKPFHGSIIWPHGQDICPDTLYIKSQLTTQSTGLYSRLRRSSSR